MLNFSKKKNFLKERESNEIFENISFVEMEGILKIN
jgi:hypothetical protein